MTPESVIKKARYLLNDETAPYRWSDDEMLAWVNECLMAMVDLRPDLFNQLVEHTCVQGAEQQCAAPRLRLVQNVLRVTGGNAVNDTSREALDMYNPSWYTMTPATAVNWMPHPESPAKFYLYPPAPIGQKVDVRIVQAHPVLTSASDSIAIPDNYEAAITAYTVARCEAKDDEQVNSGRMQAFMSDFAGMLGVGGKQ